MRTLILPTGERVCVGNAVDRFTHRDRRGRLRTYITNPNHRDDIREDAPVRVAHPKPGKKRRARAA